MTTIKNVSAAFTLAVAAALGNPARAATEDDVRAAVERFVQVQNAHDAAALEGLLLDSGQILWITRGTPIWGRAAVLERFRQNYQGTWKLDPDWTALRIVPLGSEVAQVFVPVQFTIGPAGQPATVSRFLLNQVLLKTPGGWKVASILPIPAPTQ
jgi:ketosteroid isomerase-like protein